LRIIAMKIVPACLFTASAALVPIPSAHAQTGPVKAGLVVWLEGDSGLSTDGSSWADQSGQAHNATAISGKTPQFLLHGIKKLPALGFAGGQAMSIAGLPLTSQKFTIIVVASDTCSQTGNDIYREIVSNWSSQTGGASIFLGTTWNNATGSVVDRIRFTDSIGGAGQGQTGQGALKAPAKAFVLTGLSGAKSASIQIGPKVAYKLPTALPARDLTQPWVLGRQGALDSEYWQGAVGAVLVYNRALTPTELKTDVSYLTTKWK
jgi:hypothetical protein